MKYQIIDIPKITDDPRGNLAVIDSICGKSGCIIYLMFLVTAIAVAMPTKIVNLY
jgi:hypothetical protein